MYCGSRDPCWASLPPELIRHIADCFLATNDVDYYMDLRAVCRDWRRATDDPTNTWDMRFRPNRWIVFPVGGATTTLLFVNTATGRLHRKNMPLLAKYHQAAATQGGFLVLLDNIITTAVYVLNPFTGNLACFMGSASGLGVMSDVAMVFGSPPTLMLCDIHGGIHRADLGGEHIYVHRNDVLHHRLVQQAICGGVYGLMGRPLLDDLLTLFSPGQLKMFSHDCSFLVQSEGGALMIIKHKNGGMEVVKIDAGRNTMNPTKRIGDDCAVFVGMHKCVSVDTSKFPSIRGNCIYYVKTTSSYAQRICIYDMKKEKEDMSFLGEVSSVGAYDRGITITRLLSSYTATCP